MTDRGNSHAGPSPVAGGKGPEGPIRDLTAYAWRTLDRVNQLMDRYERQEYVQVDLSGFVGKLLPYVRIPLPLLQGASNGKESA